MTARPAHIQTAAELLADKVVHVVGLASGGTAAFVLMALSAFGRGLADLLSAAVYSLGLMAMLGCSAAYNIARLSPRRELLRRFDHAAIFVMIAGTYTPFLAVLGGSRDGQLLTVLVWGAALVGVALKLIVPQRFGRLAIVLYLAIGWSGVLVFQTLATVLPPVAFWLLVAGGITYSAGIIFHVWERLKFQNVLWHIFVVAGSICHLWAIFDCMVLSRL